MRGAPWVWDVGSGCKQYPYFCESASKRFIVILRGYIDETVNARVFTLSCLISTPMHWDWIRYKWKAILREKNNDRESMYAFPMRGKVSFEGFHDGK